MHTFSFLIDGQKEVFTDSALTSIDNNRFLLMRAGKCLMTEKFARQDSSYRSMLLFFDEEVVMNFVQKYDVQLSLNRASPPVHDLPYDGFVQSFVTSLAQLQLLPAETKAKLLLVKFEELMLYLIAKNGTQFLNSLVFGKNNRDHHFRSVVENNKYNRLTLNELAFLSHMSLSTFKREFVRHFGSSPSKWFQDQRLDHAAYLMKHHARRPSDVYKDMGYESLSNFIQAFKAKYGVTPKKYVNV